MAGSMSSLCVSVSLCIIHRKHPLIHKKRIALRYHIDTSGHILQRRVCLKTHVVREAVLRLLWRHPFGQGYQHVRTLADALFHEQNLPFPFLHQLQRAFKNLFRMTLLVEVQHQSWQGMQGILDGTVIVSESGTRRRPDRQFRLHLFVSCQHPSAHIQQFRVSTHLLPILSGGGKGRSPVTPTDASKMCVYHIVSSFLL